MMNNNKNWMDHELYPIYEHLDGIVSEVYTTLIKQCASETISHSMKEYDRLKLFIKNQLNICLYANTSVAKLIINVLARIIHFHPLINGNKRAALLACEIIARHLGYQIVWCRVKAVSIINIAAMNDLDAIIEGLKRVFCLDRFGFIPRIIPLNQEKNIHQHKEINFLNRIIKKLELN